MPCYSTLHFLKDLWRFIRPYRVRFFTASLFRAIGDVSGLYFAYAFAQLINFLSKYHAGTSLSPAWTILYLWVAAMMVNHVGYYAGKLLGFSIAEQAALDALHAGTDHLIALNTERHELEGSGTKIKRIQRGREAVNRTIRIWFQNLIQISINFAGILAIVLAADKFTGLIFALFIVTFTAIAYIFVRKTTSANYLEGLQEERTQQDLFELVTNIRTIRVLNIGKSLLRVINTTITTLRSRIDTRIFWFRTQATALTLWSNAFRIGTFAFIIYGISQGRFEVGFLILFNIYLNKISESCEELAEVSQDIITAKSNLQRLSEILSTKPRPGISATTSFPDGWKQIDTSGVRFSYGTNHPVLQQITFSLRRGERIGIVGSSGAGKSTLFKLLLKEYDSFDGKILIDDLPIQSISEKTYFEKVAVVLQDTEVFNLSLRENIILANPDKKDSTELFEHAVEVSHVADFIHKLPQGYDTIIGEKGFRLSGGEKQRLGIARAIFKEPDLLLLDEATSHLDIESEEKIQDSLHQVFQHITAIVIAHRLTTISEMDRILVLEDGKIIESGTFAELQKARGRFFDLWEKQKL